MRFEKWIIPLVVAMAATYALVRFNPNPAYPELVGYSQAAFFILVFIIMKFSVTGDVKEISLIFFLIPTFLLYFGPLLLDQFDISYRQIFSHNDLIRATRLAFAGYLSYIAGHYWARRFHPPPLLRNLRKMDIPMSMLVRASLSLMILSMAYMAFGQDMAFINNFFGRILFLLDQLPMLAVALGGMAILRGYRNPFFQGLLFFVFLPVNVLVIIAHTLFYHLVILVAPLLTMYMLWRRRVPWVIALVPVILLWPAFKSRIHDRTEFGWGIGRPITELVATGFDRVVQGWKLEDRAVIESRDALARARFNSLSLLAHCVHAHEYDGRAYKAMQTFWFLPLSPIPRAVFPWKPKNDHGLTFGLEYGLREPDERFAVVLPLMVESYISGGLPGVVILGFMVGAMYYYCFALFENGLGMFNLMALLTVVYFIVYVENNITILFGGAMQAMAMWWFIDRNWRKFMPDWSARTG